MNTRDGDGRSVEEKGMSKCTEVRTSIVGGVCVCVCVHAHAPIQFSFAGI